jgi:hypothetical protein
MEIESILTCVRGCYYELAVYFNNTSLAAMRLAKRAEKALVMKAASDAGLETFLLAAAGMSVSCFSLFFILLLFRFFILFA